MRVEIQEVSVRKRTNNFLESMTQTSIFEIEYGAATAGVVDFQLGIGNNNYDGRLADAANSQARGPGPMYTSIGVTHRRFGR
jgi:hypothetical protein